MALSKKKKLWLSVTAGILVVVILATVIACCALFIDPVYNVDLDYLLANGKLKFSDEFEGDALNQNVMIDGVPTNSNVWNITDVIYSTDDVTDVNRKAIRRGAYWDMSQMTVGDGNLTIATEKKGDYWYTGGLTTLKNPADLDQGYTSKYGYYEMKAILPKGKGQWAAFWMMSDDFAKNEVSGHKNGAEIDIMEAPAYPKGIIQQAVHKGGYAEKHSSIFNAKWLAQDLGDLYDSYHTYGLYWDQDIYKFYVDRKCVWTTNYNKDVSRVDQWLFISIEIGGNAVEKDGALVPQIGASPWSFVGGESPEKNPPGFRSEFKIDYVKVWDIAKP